MTKFLHKINKHDNYIKNVTEDHQFNITLCEDEYHLHYDKWINDPYNGHDYVEIDGLKWATMNIGATSITETGLYFQWGDTQGYTASEVGTGSGQKAFKWEDYKYYGGRPTTGGITMTKYNKTDNKTVLDAEDDAVTVAWGSNWRMPTQAEFDALIAATTPTWTSDYEGSGVAGVVLTSNTDSSKKLFFPASDVAYDGNVSSTDSKVYCYSSSLRANKTDESFHFAFVYGNDYAFTINGTRNIGYTVRGVAN